MKAHELNPNHENTMKYLKFLKEWKRKKGKNMKTILKAEREIEKELDKEVCQLGDMICGVEERKEYESEVSIMDEEVKEVVQKLESLQNFDFSVPETTIGEVFLMTERILEHEAEVEQNQTALKDYLKVQETKPDNVTTTMHLLCRPFMINGL